MSHFCQLRIWQQVPLSRRLVSEHGPCRHDCQLILLIILNLYSCFRYVEHDALIWEYLNSSVHLAPYLDKKFDKIYAGESYRFYRERYIFYVYCLLEH